MLRIGGQRIPTATLALFFLDALSVVVAVLAAIVLRFHDQLVIVDYLRGPHVILRFLLVVVVCETALYYSDAYSRQESGNLLEPLMALLQGLGAACIVLAFLYYLTEAVSLGRGIAAM